MSNVKFITLSSGKVKKLRDKLKVHLSKKSYIDDITGIEYVKTDFKTGMSYFAVWFDDGSQSDIRTKAIIDKTGKIRHSPNKEWEEY